jgi:hypothetical protein
MDYENLQLVNFVVGHHFDLFACKNFIKNSKNLPKKRATPCAIDDVDVVLSDLVLQKTFKTKILQKNLQ